MITALLLMFAYAVVSMFLMVAVPFKMILGHWPWEDR